VSLGGVFKGRAAGCSGGGRGEEKPGVWKEPEALEGGQGGGRKAPVTGWGGRGAAGGRVATFTGKRGQNERNQQRTES